MAPLIASVQYDGRTINHKATQDRIETAIKSRGKILVRDIITGSGDDPGKVKKCTIEYDTGDSKRKRRSLAPHQSFDFGNDILELIYTSEVKELSAWEKIFAYMDTTDKLLVHNDLFEVHKKPDGNTLDMTYLRPDGRQRTQYRSQGQDFVFDAVPGNFKYPPRPPNPPPDGSCLCPCPTCAEYHRTKEQRKDQEERQRKTEQERQDQLEELRRSVNTSRDLATRATTIAEGASDSVEENRRNIDNVYRELADIRRMLQEDQNGSGSTISPVFKACILSSQTLALVVLASYTYRAIIQGKRS